MPYTKEDLLKELVEMYRIEDRQVGDVDCAQMADRWNVDPRISRIRLMALVKRGVLERVKVHDPRSARPIFVWRKPSDNKPAIISGTHTTSHRRR